MVKTKQCQNPCFERFFEKDLHCVKLIYRHEACTVRCTIIDERKRRKYSVEQSVSPLQ